MIFLRVGFELAQAQRESALNAAGTFVMAAHTIILSTGWARRAIALAAGAAGALAMAPFDLFPALAITMTVAVWLIDGSGVTADGARGASRWRSALAAARDGWWLGFGYFVAGLWWLGAAFLVEADQFAWALPLGVLGLPAGLAFFTALGFFLARLVWSGGTARIFALAFGLGASEWLRGVVMTGFPWNDFGLALGGNLVLAQAASLVGLHGLTFVAIVLAASPAVIADGRHAPMIGLRRFAYPPALAILVLGLLAVFGALRLAANPTVYISQAKLRIMQPNLPQDAKFRPENKEPILEQYMRLSASTTTDHPNGLATVSHLIWPESAFPFILSRDAEALAKIGSIIPRGSYLITGAARVEPARRGAGSNRALYYNSIHVIESGGQIADTYDKVHLVPFGEYLPMSSLLEMLKLRQFVHIPGGFEPGSRARLLSAPGLPGVAPLVCYEAIFPGDVVPRGGGERPGVMLNVTNDGWFGRTPGPHQHLAAARLRTIEEGLPLVRAANTGVSAVVDSTGRIVARLPLGIAGVLDSRLPAAGAATPFSRWPLAGPFALLILMLAGSFLRRRNAG